MAAQISEDTIPFNKPYVTGKELEYISEAIANRNLSADGIYTQRCSALLEKKYDIRRAYLTPSCTSALEMAAMLCDLQPGDEIIMPSFTFTSTANAVVLRGAKPVFVDIREDTLNIDESLIEAAVTPATRAVFPVHYAGVGCEMDPIMDLARSRGLHVIEDAAQGVDAWYRGQALGTIGHLGAYSFHVTKNFIAGEGGAICVNSPEYLERLEILREKGTNRSKFIRGEVDKYTWVDTGSSFLPAELTSAFLLAQLEAIDQITERRRDAYAYYKKILGPIEEAELITLPVIPEHCKSNYHLFHVLLRDQAARDSLQAFLKSRRIQSTFHYIPLHSSPMGQQFGGQEGQLSVTESAARRLLRLPFYTEITESEQERVAQAITSFFKLS